jgi:hypothetical protein
MKITRNISWLVIGTLLALSAALPAAAGDPVMSLQPLHPGREVVLEPAFEGTWVLEDFSSLMLEVKQADCVYRLRLFSNEEKETLEFDAHLVRLGGTVFVDIQQTADAGLIELHPHIFAKLRVDRDELHFDFLKDTFVEESLESGRTELRHEKLNKTLVLTAATRELQTFVQSCDFDEDAFGETVSFTRLKEQEDP